MSVNTFFNSNDNMYIKIELKTDTGCVKYIFVNPVLEIDYSVIIATFIIVLILALRRQLCFLFLCGCLKNKK